ncbi:hypothetical protein HNQ56_002154 [Anaerotaenia torta]|uniref:hypothetical protein n=1 Tax=Anaerotaenia torta TaxID=433293 RepID=UPI003D1FF909
MSLLRKLFRKSKTAGRAAEDGFKKDISEDEIPEEDFVEEDPAEDSETGEEGWGYGSEESQRVTEDPEEDPDMEYEIVEREILPAKIICPDCGGITLEGLDFCDKCGGELS